MEDTSDSMRVMAEESRLQEARRGVPWRAWGPYLSERQWGTVREDYSASGDAWSYFSHDQSRSRAYRWGEDGLAGISDDKQFLCFALALWNERDPILKERLFGLTNVEGNHGEDVKEYYFYLDNLPTHSNQRWLYKYPHAEYPYGELVARNRGRSAQEWEYELVDTGIFDNGRYFDVEVEYAKVAPEDTLCRITVHNRGPDSAALHVLPTLWFRNTWSWANGVPRPRVSRVPSAHPSVRAEHHELGTFYLYAAHEADLLFCENETNAPRIWGTDATTRFPKDGIGEHVLRGAHTVNPAGEGTKVAAHVRLEVPAGGSVAVFARLAREGPETLTAPFADAAEVIALRRAEADEFYETITPPEAGEDAKAVMRQALAGMLWSKQCYYFDVDRWLRERDAHPLRAAKRRGTRNESWFHMINHDVVSMPDNWEYPWYAAWDLAFHSIPLAIVDPDFAMHQIDLMLVVNDTYGHSAGDALLTQLAAILAQYGFAGRLGGDEFAVWLNPSSRADSTVAETVRGSHHRGVHVDEHRWPGSWGFDRERVRARGRRGPCHAARTCRRRPLRCQTSQWTPRARAENQHISTSPPQNAGLSHPRERPRAPAMGQPSTRLDLLDRAH